MAVLLLVSMALLLLLLLLLMLMLMLLLMLMLGCHRRLGWKLMPPWPCGHHPTLW